MAESTVLRVLVVDDHDLVRSGVRGVLDSDERFEVVAEASDGNEAVVAAEMHHPDVVVMDLQMPGMGGVEATRRILASRPGTAVLVLTMFDDDGSVFSAVSAGARGYVLKGAGRDELRTAVWSVANGQAVFGPGVAAKVLDSMLRPAAPTPSFPQLTPREQQVLRLMTEGQPTSGIARQLDIADKTVRNNVSSILTKLHVTDRVAAISAARAAGLGTAPVVRRCALLFSDMEGSTRLVASLGNAYPQLLAEHNQIVDGAITGRGGTRFGSAGDARFAWFARADDAVAAAVDAQRLLARHRFAADAVVRIRIGVHAGEVTEHDGDLVGLALHETARIAATAEGGVILVSSDAAPSSTPPDVTLRDLGLHELRDLDRPIALFSLEATGGW
jgi:DNA-binding NarL/FixJ family response regulator